MKKQNKIFLPPLSSLSRSLIFFSQQCLHRQSQNHHLFTPLISLVSLPFSLSAISSAAPISSPTISQALQTDSSLSQPKNLLYLIQPVWVWWR